MHDQRWKGHMETVVVLLVMMITAGLSHGVPLCCDARLNRTQCFAAPGGTVEIRLVERIETGREYALYKGIKEIVFQIKLNKLTNKHNFTKKNKYKSRSLYFHDSNGTFGMCNVTKSDEDDYFLKLNFKNGAHIELKHLHLSVQVPVSSPTLSSECLSQGQRSLSCSCKGDSVQYNWTLDGKPLTDNQLFSGGRQDTQNITLTQDLSGLLMCVVSNNVSHANAMKNITACSGFKYNNCSDSNGTHTGWVSVNDTTCPALTTTAPTTTTTPTTTTQPPSPSMAPGESSSLNAPSSFSSSSSSSSSTHIILASSNQATALDTSPAPHLMAAWFINFLPYIVGSLAALMLLLVVGVGIYCSQKKKKKSTAVTKPDTACQDVTYADVTFIRKPNTAAAAGAAGGSAGGSGGAADDDVTYADVRAFQKRSKKWSAEREVQYGQLMKVVKTTTAAADSVEYGEVKVSPGAAGPSQDSADRRPTEDESCVYSKVKVSGVDDCVYSKVKVSGVDDCVYSKVRVKL